ncbi:hypothetical protein CDAR_445741 [Caerostris darwini]|uniref:LAGLIDADG homing endonuclease n=1 Tax=Caerostris darwini TaxID=1538125 RepID=A0AAV4WP34_9ARAC|nr:hypothetical protein CDAR_445741 [Caerostris darwini]
MENNGKLFPDPEKKNGKKYNPSSELLKTFSFLSPYMAKTELLYLLFELLRRSVFAHFYKSGRDFVRMRVTSRIDSEYPDIRFPFTTTTKFTLTLKQLFRMVKGGGVTMGDF